MLSFHRIVKCWIGYVLTHVSVSLHVFHAVIVHYAKIAGMERFGHGFWQLGFSFDNFGAGFLCFGFHLLLESYSHCAAFLGLGLGYVLVGLSLVDLEGCANILAYVYIRDVD